MPVKHQQPPSVYLKGVPLMAMGYAISVPSGGSTPGREQPKSAGEIGVCKDGFNSEIRNNASDKL
jgi:hypothetical protein